MKSKDISNILFLVQEILSMYQEEEIVDILRDLKDLKLASDKKFVVESKAQFIDEKLLKQSIDRIVENIDSLSLSEIEEKLASEDIFPTMEFIRYFAKKVGVEVTSRQSRINAIHTIQRHIDRMRINKTISKRNE